MKRTLIALFLFASIAGFTATASQTPIDLSKIPNDSPRLPRAPVLIAVTACVDESELYLNFTSSVGAAIITVTDVMGTIQYQETMDTNSTSDLYIPIDMWNSGDYTLTIEYGSIALTGDFAL
jgi:Domain of unknown function (DUF3244)